MELAVALLSAQTLRREDFTVVPGERFGPIRETTTRADLARLFSAAAVTDRDVSIAEGFCTDGTAVAVQAPRIRVRRRFVGSGSLLAIVHIPTTRRLARSSLLRQWPGMAD